MFRFEEEGSESGHRFTKWRVGRIDLCVSRYTNFSSQMFHQWEHIPETMK
jgi:hypothetical protein